jgi:hypothetical protein
MKRFKENKRSYGLISLGALLLFALSFQVFQIKTAEAKTVRERAFSLCKLLTGVKPKEADINTVVGHLNAGREREAALHCIEDIEGDPFYNLTLRDFFLPFGYMEPSKEAKLDSTTATLIGITRDNIDFREALHGDILYTAPNAGAPNFAADSNDHYAGENNSLYEQVINGNASLKDALERQTQSAETPLPPEATAGVLTTRRWGMSYLDMGTNRRVIAGLVDKFLCAELDEIRNPIGSGESWVQTDVDRAPNGLPTVYRKDCITCHASFLDPTVGALAYYDFDDPGDDDDRVEYTGNDVQNKMNQNRNVFRSGKEVEDDSWAWVYSAEGNPTAAGKIIGWRGVSGGRGFKSFAREFSKSKGLPRCMVKRVYKRLCAQSLDRNDPTDLATIDRFGDAFEADNYNMKNLFISIANHCSK